MKKIFIILLLLVFSFSIASCNNDKENDGEEKKEVIEQIVRNIDSLNEPITIADKEMLLKIKSDYDNLDDNNKTKITNIDRFNRLYQAYLDLVQEENIKTIINNLINDIDKLPNQITLADGDNITDLRNRYDELSNDNQKKISNYNKLTNAEYEYKIIKMIDDLIKKIDLLPDVNELKESDIDNILELDNEYQKLDITNQEKITNYPKLKELLQEVEILKKGLEFVPLIKELKDSSVSYYDNKDKINDLKQQIDIYGYPKYIENYQDLLDMLEEIKTEENKLKAKPVIDYIDALPNVEDLVYDDRNKVAQARLRYNALNVNVRSYVTNLDKLISLENRIKELKTIQEYIELAEGIDNEINNLPTLDKLDVKDNEQLILVRSHYDNSKDEVKAYVTKLDVLVSLENKMVELINNHEYNVRFYLNGGSLEGASSVIEQDVTSFTINYYSTGFFTYYENEIFLYKTSLMGSSDSFLYAYKVGLSYNNVTKTYTVDGFVNNGTALTEEKRTSEYYLLVSEQNSNGMANLNSIKLGDNIYFNKQLPNGNQANVDIKVNVKRYDENADFAVIKYKGVNTLPIPIKAGYDFMGWYKESLYLNEVKEVSDETILYAKWLVNHSDITADTILNCVSDVVESDTLDMLILEDDDASYEWSSSNPNLYQINGNEGKTSKIYQTHKKQNVTISCKIKYKNGSTVTKQKNIIINPVKYAPFTDTPISTYFAVGAAYAYKKYNQRYLKDGTMFSETTKEVLEILNYSFAVPTANGGLNLSSPSYLEETKLLKEHDVRQVMVINGVGSDTSKYFYDITKDENLLKTFINNIMNMVEQYNFDGVDLDWEYVSSSYPVVASQVNALVKGLREEMDNRQDEGGSSYLLTAAIPSSSWGLSTSRWDFPTLNKYLDYINIMSYDLNNSSKATHVSALYSSANDGGYGFGGVYGINNITALGFDRNKLIIGCAGYGKAYNVTGTANNPNYPALGASASLTQVSGIDGSFASGTLYGNAIEEIVKRGGYIEYNERDSKGNFVASYLYNPTTKIFITYDSTLAVKEKYKYAKSMNGVGLMCWAYTEDTSDHYLDAIYQAKFK